MLTSNTPNNASYQPAGANGVNGHTNCMMCCDICDVIVKPAGANRMNGVVLGKSSKLAHALDHTWAVHCEEEDDDHHHH